MDRVWRDRLGCALAATTLGIGISASTSLIPQWGQWYSVNSAYRRQTEALLSGSLALHDDPRKVGYDMAWAEDGVQQVWGLGVPVWRLPFELLAKFSGVAAFPDRVALAAAIIVVSYALLRLAVPLSKPERLVGALLLVLFPPFLTLCRTRFDVYEEAEAYMYLTGIAIFALMLWFMRRPTLASYANLGLCSGLAAFVRPTLLCYALAAMVLAWFFAKREGWKLRRSLAGPLLFVAGCGLLFLTNELRFGSGFEFGHRLNLNAFLPMMYATRFDNPVAAAPLVSRIVELMSYLFLTRGELHCCYGYALAVLPGQAPAIRWRDIYFSTYDMTFAGMILLAWGVSVLRWWRERAQLSPEIAEITTIAAWTFLSAAPLAIFYLYYPVMSSRYMLDFAPAFAVAIWVLIQHAGQITRQRFFSRGVSYAPYVSSALVVLLASWWIYQIASAKIFPDTGGGVSWTPLSESSTKSDNLPLSLTEYSLDGGIAATNIPFNGYGWEQPSGLTGAMVILFLRDAWGYEIGLEPIEGVNVSESDWDNVRAKIGLDELRLKSSFACGGGRRLQFAREKRSTDGPHIEVAFIALTSAGESLGSSKFKLLHARSLDSEEANAAARDSDKVSSPVGPHIETPALPCPSK
jgi:hypothetical protein